MQILKPYQIKAWEAQTLAVQNCTEQDLMERAGKAVFEWLQLSPYQKHSFYFFCGKGNNGGDGLLVARLLHQAGFNAVVYILETGHTGSPLFQEQLHKLRATSIEIHFYAEVHPIIIPTEDIVLVDALLGIGLNRPIEELGKSLIDQLNAFHLPMISIDIPSGMFADQTSRSIPVIRATKTLTFQCYKPAFLYRENASLLGEIILLDIQLSSDYVKSHEIEYQFIDSYHLNLFYKHRNRFSHKGDFGHALLIAGHKGMMGAAVLAAKACLRSGVGKLTTLIPSCGYMIMQSAVPEALCLTSGVDSITMEQLPQCAFHAYGIGPGIGQEEKAVELLAHLIKEIKGPLILDADALNILAKHRSLLEQLPAGTILTPHPKEFERLFGESSDEFAQTTLQQKMADKFNVIIVLKGHFTKIAAPNGQIWVNRTGNPGLAKAGTGDILTGMITAFLAQGYTALEAAMLGVYLHGAAADQCLKHQTEESMLATDIIDHIGDAFATL